MVGLTHASSVIPVLSCSEAELGTVTRELVPLKLSALPYLPVAAQVVFASVPLLPFPDRSATDRPRPLIKRKTPPPTPASPPDSRSRRERERGYRRQRDDHTANPTRAKTNSRHMMMRGQSRHPIGRSSLLRQVPTEIR